MAKKAPVVLSKLLLMLSIALAISVAESRFLEIGPEKPPTVVCETVYGAQPGDTCFAISQKFNLPITFFSQINPNLVCEKIFAGEWLCIDGSLH